jgi:ABC-type transport system involved in multi-copper enzyme maturation permease subunit
MWTIARLDFAVWLRSPCAILAAIIPPLGMFVLVKVLTLSVTAQPVALVVEDPGPQAQVLASYIQEDTESYQLFTTDRKRAQNLLDRQRVAAVLVIPKGFDQAVGRGRAEIYYTINNTDIDFADDIRRSIDRSVASFDAPQLGTSLEGKAGHGGLVVPNPYRVDLAETDLRKTDVKFDVYQVLPVILLLVLSAGVLGGALLGSRDHERGTIVFLRQAPLGRVSFVAGRLLGALLATASIVVPAVAYLTWKGIVHPPPGHWPPFLAVLLATAVFAASVGVLLGSALRRSTTVALTGVTVASYLFFLGGGFTTIAFLPAWLQTLSRAVPTRYGIDGMRQALFYPDLLGVRTDLLALGSFALAALAASTVVLGRTIR